MNTLNDDCQLLIIKHLYFHDQLSLFEATNGEPENRLNSNICYIWQHESNFFLNHGSFMSTDNGALLDNFLSVISPTVQALDLFGFTFESLKRFAAYKFPKVTTLEYTLDRDDAECNGDLFINLFVELFPGLTCFKPSGVVNSVHLKNLINLRYLDLSDCSPPDNQFDLEIDIADLKMLEELTISNHGYDNISSALMRLTKFRKFTYHLGGQKNDDFPVGCRIKDIEKLSFNDSISFISRYTFKDLVNLRQLSILGNEDLITSSDLKRFLKDIPQLDRLDLINNVQFWELETELWETVACCPSLKILNISSMQLAEDFFYISRRPMESVLDKRSIPLTLHCHDTGGHEHLIRSYFKHPKLKLSFEPLEFNYIDSRFIEIHFLPLQIATEDSC